MSNLHANLQFMPNRFLGNIITFYINYLFDFNDLSKTAHHKAFHFLYHLPYYFSDCISENSERASLQVFMLSIFKQGYKIYHFEIFLEMSFTTLVQLAWNDP